MLTLHYWQFKDHLKTWEYLKSDPKKCVTVLHTHHKKTKTRRKMWGRKAGVSEAMSDLRSVLQSRSIAPCVLMRYMQCNYNAPQLWATLGGLLPLFLTEAPLCSRCLVEGPVTSRRRCARGLLAEGETAEDSSCFLVSITEVPQPQSPLQPPRDQWRC